MCNPIIHLQKTTDMKQHYFRLQGLIPALMLLGNFNLAAQLDLPRASQQATVSQRIGISEVQIHYSRPAVAGRAVWGQLVPYGMNNLGFGTAKESPWRAGADENTVITLQHDALVEGKALPAGSYGLHMIVYENGGATVIFSRKKSAWGSFFYDSADDALRVDVTTRQIPHTEFLTYGFEALSPTAATVALSWERKQIPFRLEFDTPAIVLADIRRKLENQEGFNRQTWEQAADYALNNGGNLEEALTWIDAAIAGQFFSQPTFANLSLKSQILDRQGRQSEALELMDRALDLATVFEVHAYGRQLIAKGEKERALRVFQRNAAQFKNTWPVDYGLARGYSALGQYSRALKHLKLAEKRAPDAPNRQAIQANIAKLEKGEDIN